jgi:hypothetical protein
MKRKKLTLTIVAVILVAAVAGTVLFNFAGGQGAVSKLYTYPFSVEEKTCIITVRTNWTSAPKVDISPESAPLKSVSVVFSGWSEETVFFNVTVPTNLLGGNISLIRKYYEQSPDQYTLSNNGTHNSVSMKCIIKPYFSGMGYFVIRGTEGA